MNREQEIEQALRRWLEGEGGRPATRSELARAIGIEPGERRLFRAILRRWQDEGLLKVGKQGRFRLVRSTDQQRGQGVAGIVRLWRNGRVMLEHRADDAEDGDSTGDGFTPAVGLLPFEDGAWGAALPGDEVEVMMVSRPMRRGGAGWRGVGEDETVVRLKRIVKRAPHRVVGRLRRDRGHCHVLIDEPMYPRRAELAPDDPVAQEAPDGSLVVVELVLDDWDTRDRCPAGVLLKQLADNRDDDPWMQRVILRHGLPLDFDAEVLKDAAKVPDEVSDEEASDREDWRNELVITIDPDDAKDFDDAISVSSEGDMWRLAVHIADVAHYVPTGGAMDREAMKRGNSVYLADRVIPMLPEKLSNGICSLRPGEDRLAQAVVLIIDGKGRVCGTRFADTVIHSRCRLTYAEAMRRITARREVGADGCSEQVKGRDVPADEVDEMLADAAKLAALLRERRMRQGSLDLDMPEVRAVIDERGDVTGIERIEHDESHQLIEEFMLAANEAVAIELQRHGAGAVHRVHDEPDVEKLFEFAEMAALHGHRIRDPSDPAQLNLFLGKIRGTVAERSLKTALLRSLKRAEYASQSLGHYGLAKAHYLHFTSPIRRYADLVVHRSLRALRRQRESGRKSGGGGLGDLRRIAAHLSQTERIAADAEMESQRLKQLQYLARLAAAPDGFECEAVIMEVRPRSMSVELEPWMIRGWVRTATLPGGRHWYDASMNRLVCREGGRARSEYKVGDRVTVTVSRIDLHELQADFEVVR